MRYLPGGAEVFAAVFVTVFPTVFPTVCLLYYPTEFSTLARLLFLGVRCVGKAWDCYVGGGGCISL